MEWELELDLNLKFCNATSESRLKLLRGGGCVRVTVDHRTIPAVHVHEMRCRCIAPDSGERGTRQVCRLLGAPAGRRPRLVLIVMYFWPFSLWQNPSLEANITLGVILGIILVLQVWVWDGTILVLQVWVWNFGVFGSKNWSYKIWSCFVKGVGVRVNKFTTLTIKCWNMD